MARLLLPARRARRARGFKGESRGEGSRTHRSARAACSAISSWPAESPCTERMARKHEHMKAEELDRPDPAWREGRKGTA